MAKTRSRKSISLDMTAMCDMGFLLLTFFILTAKMKAPEIVVVDMPSSVSTDKLQETGVLKIVFDKDGRVFFGLSDQATRVKTLANINRLYGYNFTELDKAKFNLIESFGVPLAQLKSFLALSEDMQRKYPQTGIPVQLEKNELKMWINAAVRADTKLKINVKGDRNASYESYNKIVSTLQELDLSHFRLVTTLEVKP